MRLDVLCKRNHGGFRRTDHNQSIALHDGQAPFSSLLNIRTQLSIG